MTMHADKKPKTFSAWWFVLPVALGLMFSAGMCIGTRIQTDKAISFAFRKQAEAFTKELAKRDEEIFELQKSYGSLRMDLYTEWAKGLPSPKKGKGKK